MKYKLITLLCISSLIGVAQTPSFPLDTLGNGANSSQTETGSVTSHNDVTSAGRGSMITGAEGTLISTALQTSDVSSVPTSGSTAPISSGSMFDNLALKEPLLTLDGVPTNGSSNYVNSGSVYTAINSLSTGVTSFNTRTGAVIPVVGDYSTFYLQTSDLLATIIDANVSGVQSNAIYDALAGKVNSPMTAQLDAANFTIENLGSIEFNPTDNSAGFQLSNNNTQFVITTPTTATYTINESITPTLDSDLTTKKYVDDNVASYLPLAGATAGQRIEFDGTNWNPVSVQSTIPDFVPNGTSVDLGTNKNKNLVLTGLTASFTSTGTIGSGQEINVICANAGGCTLTWNSIAGVPKSGSTALVNPIPFANGESYSGALLGGNWEGSKQ